MVDGGGGEPDGSRVRGLIDPALHRPPAGYRSDVDVAAAASVPEFRPADDSGTDERDELHVGDPGDQPSRLLAALRLDPVRTAVLALAVVVLLTGAGVGGLLVRDARRTFSRSEVLAAVQGFRTPTSRTETATVDAWPDSVRVFPASCSTFVSQRPADATDGASWSSADGPGYQRVGLQSMRFAGPAAARQAMRSMVADSEDCGRIQVRWGTFSPRWVQVTAFGSATGFRTESELHFTLHSSFGGLVYVRQHGNTVTFVDGVDDLGSARQLADDLVAELDQPAAN